MGVSYKNMCKSRPLISVESAKLNKSFLESHIKRVLCWIKQDHLEGLGVIKLQEKMGEVSNQAAIWAQAAYHARERVYGWYCPAKGKNQAYLVLYVSEICCPIPLILRWGPIFTLRLARSLAHEVAHHLQATRGYIFAHNESDDEEALADYYAKEVIYQMTENWRYRFAGLVLKEIASWHFAFGQVDWKQKHFSDAANHFFAAWDLDREHSKASRWYWRAKEELSNPKIRLLK
jgi:hypothetical protein